MAQVVKHLRSMSPQVQTPELPKKQKKVDSGMKKFITKFLLGTWEPLIFQTSLHLLESQFPYQENEGNSPFPLCLPRTPFVRY
jgi:hypothetical protein